MFNYCNQYMFYNCDRFENTKDALKECIKLFADNFDEREGRAPVQNFSKKTLAKLHTKTAKSD